MVNDLHSRVSSHRQLASRARSGLCSPHATPMSPTPILALLLLLAATVMVSEGINCKIYHHYMDDHKLRTMVPSTCRSNKYCVHATYRDSDRSKKQGYSVGCDITDCAESEDSTFMGWNLRSDGMVCKKDKDYGSAGTICCCTTEMCNHGTRHSLPVVTFLLALLYRFHN